MWVSCWHSGGDPLTSIASPTANNEIPDVCSGSNTHLQVRSYLISVPVKPRRPIQQRATNNLTYEIRFEVRNTEWRQMRGIKRNSFAAVRGLKFGRFFLVEHMLYGYTRTART